MTNLFIRGRETAKWLFKWRRSAGLEVQPTFHTIHRLQSLRTECNDLSVIEEEPTYIFLLRLCELSSELERVFVHALGDEGSILLLRFMKSHISQQSFWFMLRPVAMEAEKIGAED